MMSVEMAGRAGTGIELDLSTVPMRETGMTPYEVLLSESQERMLFVVHKGREEEVFACCRKWDLDAAIVQPREQRPRHGALARAGKASKPHGEAHGRRTSSAGYHTGVAMNCMLASLAAPTTGCLMCVK